MNRQALLVSTLLLLLAGCASTPPGGGGDSAPVRPAVDPSRVPDAVPRVEPRSRYGNPETYIVFGKTYRVLDSATGFRETGIASWYGTKFHGRRTSSGEPYDMYAMTAAHKSLPLPAYVRVTHRENGRQIVVRVNDRGPFHPGRIIDLSYTAAAKLGILEAGSGPVEIEVIDPRAPSDSAPWPPVSGRQQPAPAVADIQVPAPGNPNSPPHSEPWMLAPVPLPSPSTDPRVSPASSELPESVESSGAPPSPATGPRYYLQAGAYRDPINAEDRVTWIKNEGISAVQLRQATVAGSPLLRVYVGPYTTLEQVDEARQRLQAMQLRPRLVTEPASPNTN